MSKPKQPFTDIRSEEQQLAHYRSVLASTLDPVVTIDSYGIIQSASASVRRVFGYDPGELVGQNISTLMPEPHRSLHDSYLALYRATGETNILGRTREFEGVRKDGSRFPLEIAVARVEVPGQEFLLLTGIIRDISERRRAEREVQLLQTLALAIGSAPDENEAMRLTLREICLATGWDYGEAWLAEEHAEEARDTPVWYAADERIELFQQLTRRVRFRKGEGLVGRVWATGQPESIENLRNESRFLRARAAKEAGLTAGVGVPILSAGRVVAVMVFLMRQARSDEARELRLVMASVASLGPLIEHKQSEQVLLKAEQRFRLELEDLVAERTIELEQSHGQLRQADRLAAMGTLAAGLGHDMNNIVLTIRCHLDVLLARITDAKNQGDLKAIRRWVDYLDSLSAGLRLLTQDPSQTELVSGRTVLHDWCEQVGTVLNKALHKGIEFKLEIPPSTPPIAIAPHKLTQAVLNLVINAGEAITGEGHVTLWADTIKDGEVVRMGVTDDGCGMNPELADRVLDPFFTTKTRGLSTGLGLSLAQGVASAARGSLRIESAAGVGTTVTIEFPIAPMDMEQNITDDTHLIAGISMDDDRLAAYAATILESLGVEAHRDAPSRASACALWITDPSDQAKEYAAERSAADQSGSIIVVGDCSDGWEQLATIIVDGSDVATRLRGAIQTAVDLSSGDVR